MSASRSDQGRPVPILVNHLPIAPGSFTISNDSVTSVPEPDGSNRYRHLVSPLPTSKANSRPGSAAVTVHFVVQPALRLFLPLKRAPTVGPLAPSSHSPPTFS